MSAIQKYRDYKYALSQAKNWFALIGSRYSGGGGGIGEIVSPLVKFDIYHQPYDGATNYHSIPNEHIQRMINEVVASELRLLVLKALDKMDKQLGILAQQANEEAAEILKDSELAKV